MCWRQVMTDSQCHTEKATAHPAPKIISNELARRSLKNAEKKKSIDWIL